jgi:hypothetical protein
VGESRGWEKPASFTAHRSEDQDMSVSDQVIRANATQRERALLVEALELLMRERSNALRIATAVAKARGERVPEVHDFGLDDILRLSRRIAEAPSAEATEGQPKVIRQDSKRTGMGRRTLSCQVSNQE